MSLPPPPPPYGQQPPPPDVAEPRSWRHELAVAAVIIVLLELAAFPLGLLWGHLAPHPLFSTGSTSLDLREASAKPLVRADAWFLLVTGLAGLVAGGVTFFAAKRAEIGATLGLAVGGLMAGWLAWRVGHAWTGGLQPIALALKPTDTQARLAADLGARVVLISWAVAAVAAHALLYAVTWPAKQRPEQVPTSEPVGGLTGDPVAGL